MAKTPLISGAMEANKTEALCTRGIRTVQHLQYSIRRVTLEPNPRTMAMQRRDPWLIWG